MLTCCCLLLDCFGTFYLFEESSFRSYHIETIKYAFGGGLIVGQLSLLVIWGVLGNEALMCRLPRATALSFALFLAWLAGTHLADDAPPWGFTMMFIVYLAICFTMLTFPYWLMLYVTSLRIVRPGQTNDPDQFSTRQLFAWTAGIAILTVVTKALVLSTDDSYGLPPGRLVMFGVIITFISVFVLALSVPLLFGVLRSPVSKAGWSVAAIMFLVAPPVLLEGLYFAAGQNPSSDDRWYGILAWYAFYVGMVLTMCIGLLIVRAYGFRLTRVHRQ